MHTTVGVFVAVLIFQFSITISLLIAVVLLMVDLEVYGFMYIIGAKLNCKTQFSSSLHIYMLYNPSDLFFLGVELSQNFNLNDNFFVNEFSVEKELPKFWKRVFFLEKFSVEKEFARFLREFFSDTISPHFNTVFSDHVIFNIFLHYFSVVVWKKTKFYKLLRFDAKCLLWMIH